MTGILPVDIKMLLRSRMIGIESELLDEIPESISLDTVAWVVKAGVEPEDLLVVDTETKAELALVVTTGLEPADLLVVDTETEAELALLETICTAERLDAISREGRVPETEGSDVVARLEEDIC